MKLTAIRASLTPTAGAEFQDRALRMLPANIRIQVANNVIVGHLISLTIGLQYFINICLKSHT